jgi:malate dehydrogenase
MVESVVRDQRRLLPVSAYLDGEYGHRSIYLGVPAILGKRGVERIVQLPLSDQERGALDASADAVREGARLLDSLYRDGVL